MKHNPCINAKRPGRNEKKIESVRNGIALFELKLLLITPHHKHQA